MFDPDVVQDFDRDEGDLLDLSAIDADVLASGDQAFEFRGAQPFAGKAGELVWDDRGDHVLVLGDVDGDSAADLGFVVRGVDEVLAGDFVR